MSLRVATFNVENLFARYKFREGKESLAQSGFGINDISFDFYNETSKQLTAKTIRKVSADIICLQEIENLPVLERFNSRYLGGMKYRHRMLIDSHDPRFIDVAVLSRFPIINIKTYRQNRNSRNTAWLFSRDCLEVDIDVDGKILTLYVNHFKSMMGGRDNTKERREEQVTRVSEIVDERWKKKNYEANFIVLGDFNDYVDPDTSLNSLIKHEHLVNIVKRLSEEDQWTHYYSGRNSYSQLDYLLLSKTLADNNSGLPGIFRNGLPHKAEKYTGERFEEVGENHPKASDHAALYMDLDLV